MFDSEKIVPVFIEDEMQKSYLAYSMSMITSRALPDVRDGLKPVHRRVLFGMSELSLVHNKPPKKCARVVGDVIGKYHPHGDGPVYDTLVRMAQDFSMRYRMVDGQGNFGSIDGDPPAAMRYTECRMTSIAEEMLADLDKETVDFIPNYDDSMTEPSVLPARVPFLLINGSTGIAVGMATNIPPHNLTEIINAVVAVINDPAITHEELFKIVPGPDFPTGGIINGRSGIWDACRTGRGKAVVRARAEIEKLPNDREQIAVTEIPYMVNKTTLLERMSELVRDKAIEGISFIRDESDRRGMRIVIGIKKDNFGEVILNQLYKFTSMQSTFGIINLALVNKRPQLLSLKQIVEYFIEHRHEVVVRRTQYDLRKTQERAHILEGLKIALDNIDEIIQLIKASPSSDEALIRLVERFGLSEIQAKAILEMRLQRLTGLEREKLEAEYRELMITIARLTALLADRALRMVVITNELIEIRDRFGDARRTEIVDAEGDVDIEDMIADEDMVITMSHGGYIKRIAAHTYRSQGRGGRGIKGMDSKDDDFVQNLFVASTHSYILFFTTRGRCYWLKVYRIPEASRSGRGKAIVNLIELKPDEKIVAFVPVKEFNDTSFIMAATRNGVINKQPLKAYSNIRRDGINAFNLDEGDCIIECKLTSGNDDIILATRDGSAVRFHESATRELGRNTRGMKGITLRGEDVVVGMIVVSEEGKVLTVTENGYGKVTPVADYRRTNRGGLGIINIKCSERNGCVVAVRDVPNECDVMLITRNGIIIRSDASRISVVGRNTQGVRLISLDTTDKVIDCALCDKDETKPDEESGEPLQVVQNPSEGDDTQPVEAVDTTSEELDEPEEEETKEEI